MKTRLDKVLPGSVQKKILLLVLVSVLPSLAVIVNSGLERRDASLERTRAETLALAAQAADVLNGHALKVRALLTTLTSLPAQARGAHSLMPGMLAEALERNPEIEGIVLVNPSGEAAASAGALGQGPCDARSVQPGPGAFRARASFPDSGATALQVCFSYQSGREGETGWTAAALVRMEELGELPGRYRMPGGTAVMVADPDGRMLYSTSLEAIPPEWERGEGVLKELIGRRDAGLETVQGQGSRGLVTAFLPLAAEQGASPYAYVLASVPSEQGLLRMRGAVWRDVLLVLAASALAVFLGGVAGRLFIVNKLDRLIGAAGRFRAGDLKARSGLDYRDGELGLLGQAFDAMAETLAQDIARRERAERETASSRDFLDKILNSIADPIFVKDSSHRFILVNDALCAAMGAPRENILGKTDADFLPREEAEFFWEHDDMVLESGEEDQSEEFMTGAGGETRTIVTRKTRYVDAAGNRHVVGVIRDVTEVKRAGMELIARTAQLDARVKMLDCLYGVSHLGQKRGVTLDRILAEASALLPPMLTYPGGAVRIVYDGKRYPLTEIPPLSASMTADIVARGACRGFIEAGYPEPRPVQEDGPFTREEAKILRVVAEHLGQMAERALAEEELKQSEERFRRIVETANEGIAVLDPSNRVTYVNTVMAGMLGYEAAEMIGRNIESFFHEPPAGERRRGAKQRHAFGARRERLFRRKDGTILCAIASVTPVTDREGRLAGSFGMYADITDRKMAEEKLQELNESLEQLVRDRTGDLSRKTADLETKAIQLERANRELTETAAKLERSRRRAEEATKAKSVFLANMSHEVRTPINAILGLSDLALRRGAQGEPRRFLEMILKSSRGLLALVNDILDFSKLEAGKSEVDAMDFDLPRLVRDAVSAFAHQAEAKSISLDLTIDDDVPRYVASDPTKLRAILSNLCSNAVKFTESGGVAVLVRFERRDTVFVVEDTGIGIPEDKRGLVFKSFRQADESVGRKYGGTGLGLTISRKYARLLGGTLKYEAREGGGSRFILTLPLRPGVDREEDREKREEELALASRLAPMRILLAEDHEMGRELITTFLGGFGHEVVCAGDGAQAVEKLRDGGFDLVLMDGRMPVMDGLAAARAIRGGASGAAMASVPIVAITAQAMEGDREAFLKAGMDGYVTKPVDLDEVLLVLARHAPPGKRPDGAAPALSASPVAVRGERTGQPRPEIAAPHPMPGDRPVPGERAGDPLLDREGALARLKGMTVLLEAMEATFMRTAPEDLAALSAAAGAGDAENARLYAHRMKGNAAGVGAMRLSAEARRMEARAASGGVPTGNEMERLNELFRLTATEMERARTGPANGQVFQGGK